MTQTKTDKIRAALEAALSDDQPYIDRCKEAISELDGCVIVPVEPTEEQINTVLGNNGIGPITARSAYIKMIAPYVNGEKK